MPEKAQPDTAPQTSPAQAGLNKDGHGGSTRRPHLAWVAWVRVVAILGVISIHNMGPTAAEPGARGQLSGQVAIALDLGFIWAVPLFVMVSGALLLDPSREVSSGAFLRRRAARLVPPLVFWHAFYVAFLGLDKGGRFTTDFTMPTDVVQRILTGQLVPHLYFFWIVLGLALVAPVLQHWLRATSRREWVIGGLVATVVPVATAVHRAVSSGSLPPLETAWNWWIFYLGVFILGAALRGVVLEGRRLVAAAAAVAGLLVLIVWQWRNPDAPDWLQVAAPVSYYGPTVILVTVLLFLVAQSAVRRGGPLSALASPRVMRWVEPVGAATLGIYGLHLAVLTLANERGWFGPAVTSVPLLAARFVVVTLVTLAVVLVLRRVPLARRVL